MCVTTLCFAGAKRKAQFHVGMHGTRVSGSSPNLSVNFQKRTTFPKQHFQGFSTFVVTMLRGVIGVFLPTLKGDKRDLGRKW